MTRWEAARARAARVGTVRIAGLAVLFALAAVLALEPEPLARLRTAGFDALQTASPRVVKSMPAVIVDIDERSLEAIGRWPWPRSTLAELVERTAVHGPAVIGLDLLMPEPDPASAASRPGGPRRGPAGSGDAAATLATNDELLARALAAAPSVLAFAGMPEPTGRTLSVVPVVVRPGAGTEPKPPRVLALAGAMTSLPRLDEAATGHGLISAETARGVTRRVPLVASVGGTLVPAFALELLRVAIGAPRLVVTTTGADVETVVLDTLVVPAEADGALRIDYSRHDPRRFVSAKDVLDGRVDRERLERKVAIVAVTGLGIADRHTTPLGERVPGAEIHAQLVENLYDGTSLKRPRWMSWAETAAFVLLGLVLVWATPRWRPRLTALAALGGVAAMAALAFTAFHGGRLLADAATPSIAVVALFGTMLALTLAEANRHRRVLERAVAAEREQRARLAGELEAARRIQTATLPSPERLRGDPRIDLAVSMIPAREVGGDLYDFFPLDDKRLFVLVGDVAGKGLSASIFMAVSKALFKSATLRSRDADLAAVVSAANAEVSRDNPEMMFVTVFAAILDLDDGELVHCNAGHENPVAFDPATGVLRRLADGGGPPLCAVDEFGYRDATTALACGEWLCIVSDGVSEAQSPAGELYGMARVERTLARVAGAAATAQRVLDELRADVDRFVAGGEPADDATILVLRRV